MQASCVVETLSFIDAWKPVPVHGCFKRLFIYLFLFYLVELSRFQPILLFRIFYFVKLSRFQPILKLKVTFDENLFTLNPFKAVYC